MLSPLKLTKQPLPTSIFPVFNLTEGIDVAECEAKLTKHAAENASSIAAHAAAAAERARLVDRAEPGATTREGGERPEAAAATTTAAAAPPPPMFNQPPPMPLGLPPEPITSEAAAGDATMTDATEKAEDQQQQRHPPPFAASGGAPKTPLDYLRMGAASGWDAKGARRRGIAEAFRSLFAF